MNFHLAVCIRRYGELFYSSGEGLSKLSALDCDYILADNFGFGYTFSVNTFQQFFNRKIDDFDIVCTANVLRSADILATMTGKSEIFCGKVFTLDERYSINF